MSLLTKCYSSYKVTINYYTQPGRKGGAAGSTADIMEYKIIFSTNNETNKTVVFGKEFPELKGAFDWADWFMSKHEWVSEYKIKPVFSERRRKSNEKSRN